MNCFIRRAQISDYATLKAVDSCTASDPSRADKIKKWLTQDEVFLAEADENVVGYAVLRRHHFFDHDNLEMLMIGQPYRGQHVGEILLRHAEALIQTDKFFITTNLSNRPMQRLLAKLGYDSCGFIDRLDPGDPEIVFTKRITKTSP